MLDKIEKVNHSQIDAEHDQIIYNLKLLIATKPSEEANFQTAFDYLITILNQHFENEETQLEALGFPSAAHHATEHKQILIELNKHSPQYLAMPKVIDYLASTFSQSLNQHINVSDMVAADFINRSEQ